MDIRALAEALRHIEESLRHLGYVLAIVGVVAVLAAVLAGWAVVALRRLAKLREQESLVRAQEREEDLEWRKLVSDRLFPEKAAAAMSSPARLVPHFGPNAERGSTPSEEPPEAPPPRSRRTVLPTWGR